MPHNVDLCTPTVDRVGGTQIARGAWTMPRFYFHVWRGGQLEVDEAGVALPTLDSARRTAERIASVIVVETPFSPERMSSWDVEVTDQTGQTVFICPIGGRHDDHPGCLRRGPEPPHTSESRTGASLLHAAYPTHPTQVRHS